jgi:hypothetical protein
LHEGRRSGYVSFAHLLPVFEILDRVRHWLMRVTAMQRSCSLSIT